MCCSQLCTLHAHTVCFKPASQGEPPTTTTCSHEKTQKTEQPQRTTSFLPFSTPFILWLLHGQLKAISPLGKACYFRHWINHNTHKVVRINTHSYHKSVGCLFLLDFFCCIWSGSLCRAWTGRWRINKRLIHDSEADLLPNVHVKVMGPFFCLVFPYPHLLCFITGQGLRRETVFCFTDHFLTVLRIDWIQSLSTVISQTAMCFPRSLSEQPRIPIILIFLHEAVCCWSTHPHKKPSNRKDPRQAKLLRPKTTSRTALKYIRHTRM